MENRFYNLVELPYEFEALSPVISADQLKIHYEKHHKAYVDKANEILKSLDMIANGESSESVDFNNLYRKLTFNAGGIILHNLFWKNMRSAGGETAPSEDLIRIIEENFGDLNSFKKQFFEVATTIEGSGWAALFHCKMTNRLMIAPIQNHNLNIYPMFNIVLVLDMWEHSYYLDYKNDKKTYAENFWKIVNWSAVEERLKS